MLSRLGRAFAAALACVTFLAAAPARAGVMPTPPVFPSIDEQGVDVPTGSFTHSETDIVIGPPGEGGLSFTRYYQSGSKAHWTNNHNGFVDIKGTTCTVVLGTYAETFSSSQSGCNGSFTSQQKRGSILERDGNTFIFTLRDGTVARFFITSANDPVSVINLRGISDAYIVRVDAPDGVSTHYSYEVQPFCWEQPFPPDGWYWMCQGQLARLVRVSNTLGYSLFFEYRGPLDWYELPQRVIGINLKDEYCGSNCTLPWPTANYTYSGQNITSVTNTLGAKTTYTYSSGQLSKIQFPGQASHNITISYATNLVTSVNRGFGTWSYSYSESGGNRTTTLTHPDGATRAAVSSIASGNVLSIRNELNHTVSFQYDGFGRQTRVTQPEGNYVEYTYDDRGNITQTRQVSKTPGTPADIVTKATFPACTSSNRRICNQPATTIDARGYRTNYTYDNNHGGVLTITAPAPAGSAPVGSGTRPQTRYTYAKFQSRHRSSTGSWVNGSALWRLTGVSTCATGQAPGCVGTADETVTTITYPGAGTPNNVQATSITTRAGNSAVSATTTMTYTSLGDVLTVDGPLPGSADTTRFYYDAGRRLIGTVGPSPSGSGARRAVRTTYNAINQAIAVERGTASSQGDSALSSLSVLEKRDTIYDKYARPVQSRLWNAAQHLSALTQYSYDSRGRLRCSAQRMNPSTFSSPPTNVCSLATTGSFGPDRITRYTYNDASQVTHVRSAHGTALAQNTEIYAYSPNGQILTLTDARGYRTTYVYDGFDRITRKRYPNPSNTGQSSSSDYDGLTYDAYGRVTQERRRSGEVFQLSYDNVGRVTLRTAPGSQPNISYSYDLFDRTISESQAGNTITTAYDALSRVTSVTSSVLGKVSYAYDAAGRRTQMTYPGGFSVSYSYNGTGEITEILENGSVSLASYAYDGLGQVNRITRGNGVVTQYIHNSFSKPSTIIQNPAGSSHDTTFNLSYNPAGQITSRTRTNNVFDYVLPASFIENYAANGLNHYTSVAGSALTHDVRGNLTNDGTQTYTYDFDNQLTSVPGVATLSYDPLGRLHEVSGASTTQFLYDGLDVIAEYNGSGTVLRRYVHGPGLDEPLVWYEGSGTGNKRWLLSDERGSVIGITNSSGTVTHVNRYDAFGVPDPANEGRFQYTGQMWIEEIGLYHYKARVYHPELGRFLQTDPIGYAGGMNLYGYVRNDPINARDPLGLQEAAIDSFRQQHCNQMSGMCTPVAAAMEEVLVVGNGCNWVCQFQLDYLLTTSDQVRMSAPENALHSDFSRFPPPESAVIVATPELEEMVASFVSTVPVGRREDSYSFFTDGRIIHRRGTNRSTVCILGSITCIHTHPRPELSRGQRFLSPNELLARQGFGPNDWQYVQLNNTPGFMLNFKRELWVLEYKNQAYTPRFIKEVPYVR